MNDSTHAIARYGWIPDPPDQRDAPFVAQAGLLAMLPHGVDLRRHCPVAYDQGSLGSCTANAIAAGFEFDLLKQKLADFRPSRLFIYYNERAIEGALRYFRIRRDIEQFKACLASGYPFVFGFVAYESFEGQEIARTGIGALPSSGEKIAGGHAVLAAGYDDEQRRFIVRNSWRSRWGRKGYFTMPYAYLENERLSSDFWTIRVVSELTP
jgi:C1A family cysteine protease